MHGAWYRIRSDSSTLKCLIDNSLPFLCSLPSGTYTIHGPWLPWPHRGSAERLHSCITLQGTCKDGQPGRASPPWFSNRHPGGPLIMQEAGVFSHSASQVEASRSFLGHLDSAVMHPSCAALPGRAEELGRAWASERDRKINVGVNQDCLHKHIF